MALKIAPNPKSTNTQGMDGVLKLRNTFYVSKEPIKNKAEAVAIVECGISEFLMSVMKGRLGWEAMDDLKPTLKLLNLHPADSPEHATVADQDKAFQRAIWRRISEACENNVLPDKIRKHLEDVRIDKTEELIAFLKTDFDLEDDETLTQEIVHRSIRLRLQCSALGIMPYLCLPTHSHSQEYFAFLRLFKTDRRLKRKAEYESVEGFLEDTMQARRKHADARYRFAHFPGLHNERGGILFKCRVYCD